jgi:galactokinase
MLPAVEAQPNSSTLEEQVTAAISGYDFFEVEKPVWVARAPGRLDFMGGNVDYTGGMVLQGLLRESVCVAAQPRSDFSIQILNPGAAQFGWEPALQFQIDDLNELKNLRSLCTQQANSKWASYVLGAFYFLKKHYPGKGMHGVNLFIASDLPPNRGVSSSAALEIAALKALASAWQISLGGVELAAAGQWVENVVVGAACGIMDQAVIVLGRQDQLLPLLCQPCQPYPLVALPPGLSIWGIDSMVPRSTNGRSYEIARAAAFMGYKLICQRERLEVISEKIQGLPRWTDSRWHGYISSLALSDFRANYERWLPESLNGRDFLAIAGEHADPFTRIDMDAEYPVRAAVRYAIEEHLRVRTVTALLQADLSNDTLALIGEILCQSHIAYAECGLGCDACDELVARSLKAGFPGAKMTGGGAGGVVAILGRSSSRDSVLRIAEEFAATRSAMPHIFEGGSNGVDTFGVHVLKLPKHREI